MVDKLYIPVIEGTKRAQRQSMKAAKLVYEVGKTFDEIEVELLDPNDFNFPGDGNDPEGKDPKYTKITERADGFFIVTPEYNHGYPGTLKRMLDSELKNYVHKPVAFAGVSNGFVGGARVIEALVPSVREMGLVATFSDVYFPKVQDLFDKDGKLVSDEKKELYQQTITTAYEELIWMAKVMKWGRQNLPSKFHDASGGPRQ